MSRYRRQRYTLQQQSHHLQESGLGLPYVYRYMPSVGHEQREREMLLRVRPYALLVMPVAPNEQRGAWVSYPAVLEVRSLVTTEPYGPAWSCKDLVRNCTTMISVCDLVRIPYVEIYQLPGPRVRLRTYQVPPLGSMWQLYSGRTIQCTVGSYAQDRVWRDPVTRGAVYVPLIPKAVRRLSYRELIERCNVVQNEYAALEAEHADDAEYDPEDHDER